MDFWINGFMDSLHEGACVHRDHEPAPTNGPLTRTLSPSEGERENRRQRVCNGRFIDANDGQIEDEEERRFMERKRPGSPLFQQSGDPAIHEPTLFAWLCRI